MDTVPARQLLTPLRPSMTDFFYADYNMNLYRGCCHGCIYCDSRSLCLPADGVRPGAGKGGRPDAAGEGTAR